MGGCLMVANRSVPADAVLPRITYRDVAEASAWLTSAFGFVEHYRYGPPSAPSGAQIHLGDAWVVLDTADAGQGTPTDLGYGTQSLTVFVRDIDAHYETAKAADATIVEDLHETDYGVRQYGVRDLDGHYWIFSAHPTRWRNFKTWIGERKGSKLYEAADPPAEWIKAIVQMLIGVITVITIAVLVWIPRFHSNGIAELALRIVAIGLALAAVVELTYTLFTDGPDEALNPLILGLSSFILIKISDPGTDLTMGNTGAFALLILALGALFVIREIFIEKPKKRRDRRAPDTSDEGHRP
jgi:uncharacterized glyoxalase superfamily protein PhnB